MHPFRRMILTGSLFLGLFAVGIAMGAVENPERFHQGKRTFARGLGVLMLAIGHAVVLDQDLCRRQPHHRGGGYILAALIVPPVAVSLYLVRTYGARAAMLSPLYAGVVGTAGLAGYGLGRLWLLA